MKKDIEKIIEIAKKLDWLLQIDKDQLIFEKYSPAGQDFSMTISKGNLNSVIEQIKERCDNFDCSYETYIWLDNTGHGINGAPNNIKDIYDDMVCCLQMMKELYNELIKLNI